jgi:hypothetical protein
VEKGGLKKLADNIPMCVLPRKKGEMEKAL